MFRLRLLAGVCVCAALACAETTEKLLAACKQIAATKTNERIAVMPQDFDSGLCWGSFSVLEQMLKPAEAAKSRPQQATAAICAPENEPRARLIAAFAAFAKSHPERSQEDFLPVAQDALKAAFPCAARRKP